VKDLPSRWALFTLLAPVFLILALVLLGDWRPAAAAKVPSGDGTVHLAFIGNVVQVDASNVPIANPPPLPYQHLYLNVIGIRLNTSTDPNVAEGDKNWFEIPAPVLKGVGKGTGTAQLTVDITQISQLANFFNNANIKAKQYNQIELLLNSGNPGSIVPLCGALASPGEGCSSYPIIFPSGGASIRTTFLFNLHTNTVLPLVIDITVDVPAQPLVTGNQVTVQVPTITAVPNSDDTQPLNPYLALVTGTIKNGNGSSTLVNAEPAGTSDLVSPINPFNTVSGNRFSLYLPALPTGTAYDFYVSANDRAFGLANNVIVVPATNTPLSITLPTRARATVKGSLVDACHGGIPPALQNATLTMLQPVTQPTSGATPDCTLAPCVAVATAGTDPGGNFPTPVPGDGNGTESFTAIPQGLDYVLIVNAPGFDRTVIPVIHKSTTLTCVGTQDTKNNAICNLALSHGYLDGSLDLSAPTVVPLNAQVVVEDTGTSNLENANTVTIPAGQTQATFSGTAAMFVPDQGDPRDLSGFDLYALIDDDINGVGQSNTGHSIPVEAAVPVPSACATVIANTLADITCVGHGSIEGSIADATAATTAVLEKPDPNLPSDLVQLISGLAGPYGLDGSSGYALCAPADDYFLQRFDHGIGGAPTPVALAAPAQPTASSTPCPSICQAGQGASCLVCTNTAGPSL